jgi:hypothetical protein
LRVGQVFATHCSSIALFEIDLLFRELAGVCSHEPCGVLGHVIIHVKLDLAANPPLRNAEHYVARARLLMTTSNLRMTDSFSRIENQINLSSSQRILTLGSRFIFLSYGGSRSGACYRCNRRSLLQVSCYSSSLHDT